MSATLQVQHLAAQTTHRYRTLIVELAQRDSGVPLDMTEIAPVLQAAGYSVSDLSRHLNLARSRKDAVESIDKAKLLDDELKTLNARSEEFHRQAFEMSKRHKLEIQELRVKLGVAEYGDLQSRQQELIRQASGLRANAEYTLRRTGPMSRFGDGERDGDCGVWSNWTQFDL